jgi:flagellar biosynthesis protein
MSGARKQPLAIALKYDAPNAPRVVAKGTGTVAERIVETAMAAGVPIEENDGLASALATIELDQEIPPALYRAVAEVIAFVLRTAATSDRGSAGRDASSSKDNTMR